MIASLFRLLIVTGIILIPKVHGLCPTPDGKYTEWTMQFGSPADTIYEVLKGNDETAEAFVKFAAAQKDLVEKVDDVLYQSCVGTNLTTYEKKFLDEKSVLIAEKHDDDLSGNSTFEIRRTLSLIFPDSTENASLELLICVTGNAYNAYVVAYGDIKIDNGIDVQIRTIYDEIENVEPVEMTRLMCYQKEVNEAMILLRAFISSSHSRSEEVPKSDSDTHRDPQIDFPGHEGSKKDHIHQEDTKKDSGAPEDLKDSGAQEDLKDSVAQEDLKDSVAQEDLKDSCATQPATQPTNMDSHYQDQDQHQHTLSNLTQWLGLGIVPVVFGVAWSVVCYLLRKSDAIAYMTLRNESADVPMDDLGAQRDQMNEGQENDAPHRINISDSE